VVCAVARQLTNCHRQLLAIRFIPERPRSVYVVRRGMINQRRVASRRIRVASRRVASRRVESGLLARSLVASIASTIGKLGRNMAVRPASYPERHVGLFLPLSLFPGPKLFIAVGLMSTFCEHEKFRGPYVACRIRQHF